MCYNMKMQYQEKKQIMVNLKNLKIVLLSAVAILLSAISVFATEHYEIVTSSSIANETYSYYSQSGTGESSYGGVFYIGNNGDLTLDNTDFYNNYSVRGGAIYNSGTMTIDDVLFSGNSASSGGALYNTKTSTVTNTVFCNNSALYGGAVYANQITIGEGVVFTENQSTSNGGAIYSAGALYISSGVIFTGNQAVSTSAGNGGAIYGTSGSKIEIGDGVIFSSNTATASSSRTGYGGAIYASAYNSGSGVTIGDDAIFDSNSSNRGGALYIGSETNLNIGDNATFTSNKAGSGGVLYNLGYTTIGENAVFEYNETTTGILSNNGGSITIKGNALFKSNIASNTGAIADNMGTITIEDGARFISNVSTQYASGGGNIRNSGTLNLIANTNNVEFTGNKNGYASNAVRNDKTMNLWASDTADIIFNDRITGSANGIININSSTTTFTANGRIILNEDMSGYNGTTNIYGGEVEFQSKKGNNSKINTYKFFNGTVNISSGTLNIMNKATDNISLATLTLTENVNLKFDADLVDNTSDNFTITNTITEGELNLTGINILGCDKDVENGTITLFKNGNSPVLNILTTANCGGNIYTFTNGDVAGTLNYVVSGHKTFKEYVNDTENEIRSYSFGVGGETVTENLGDLGGTELTIFGNGYDLTASSVTGINVGVGQTLNIDNINEIIGFKNEDDGGFLYNEGNINAGNSTSFSSNSADNGGAIYNSLGILTINNNTSFFNNTATSQGGAVYNNEGIIDLTANTGNIEFTGNTANGISNAIHDNNGTINLWASENASIIFNDRITSEDSLSIMNINSATTTVITKGQVILNEDMSGYTGTVNLYGGELLLQSQTEEDSDINTNKLFSGTININDGTLNILNNAIDNITLSTFTVTENAGLKFDANLSNNTSDNFTVTNNITGILNLTAINLLEVDQDSGQITLFNDENAPELNILTTGVYKGYEYTFVNSDVAGVLNYEKTGLVAKTFKEYVNAEEPEIRSYSLSENETVNTHLYYLGGDQLTIFGNGYDIIADYYNGIYVDEGKALNVEDVNNYSGFSSTFGAIRNEGILNISGTNFSNNSGQDIVNHGNLTLSGTASSFGTGIRNYDNSGTTTIDGVDINLGDTAFIYQESIIINDGGSLTANASNVKGNITNDGTLIFTNGTNGNDINGEGVLEIVGNTSNIKSIVQNIIINDGGSLTTSANNVKGNITNDGTLIFTNGTNGNDINGEGVLEIVGNTSNSKSIIQNIIVVDGSLENNSVITADDIYINGTFKIGKNGNFYSATNSIISDGSSIDLQNSKIQDHNFGKLTVSSGKINLSVDADLERERTDTISVDEDSEIDGIINIKTINILKDNKDITEILFTDLDVLKNKITISGTAKSKLYKYEVYYDDGYLKFINGNNPLINPTVVEQAVAGYVGGFAAQSAIFDQAFMSLDGELLNVKKNNVESTLQASAGEQIFVSEKSIERGLWLRPFVLQDSVKMGVYDVDNSLYGTLAGIDLPILDNILTSLYLGYVGSTQKYDEVNMSQTGYVVGATGMLVKENYYVGLTANMIFNKASADTDDGTDEFDMDMFSIGAKAGYLLDIGKNWILEPNLTLMYGTVDVQEYETGMGAEIDSQSISNIVAEPQIKAKLQLKGGWQPYGLIGYVANMNDNAKVVADSLEFEIDKVDGYIEYGAGVNKDFIGTVWSCYAQVTGRSGGRSGFAGNFGVKYRF